MVLHFPNEENLENAHWWVNECVHCCNWFCCCIPWEKITVQKYSNMWTEVRDGVTRMSDHTLIKIVEGMKIISDVACNLETLYSVHLNICKKSNYWRCTKHFLKSRFLMGSNERNEALPDFTRRHWWLFIRVNRWIHIFWLSACFLKRHFCYSVSPVFMKRLYYASRVIYLFSRTPANSFSSR